MKPAFAALASILLYISSCSPHERLDPADITPETAGFSFISEVQTEDCSVTRIRIGLSNGPAGNSYLVSVILDGKRVVVPERAVSFGEDSFLTLDLPGIMPGAHTIRITLSLNGKSLSAEHSFTEPLRHPDFDVYITTEGKKTYISFGDNPYDVAVSLVDTLSVTGVCTYTVCTYEGYTRKESKTLTKTERGRMTRFIPEEGEKYELCDSENLEDLLGCMGIMNWGWGTQWDSSGEGSVTYYEEAKGMSYYQVTSRSISIKADIEAFSGMTINVHNSYPSLWWNGTLLSRSTYSYKLQ